jgi:hypothetical protein
MKRTGVGLLLLLVLAAAAWFLYDPDRNVIDDELLETQEFQSLNEEATVSKENLKHNLGLFIQGMYQETNRLEPVLPIRLDSTSISSFLADENRHYPKKKSMMDSHFSARSFYSLGSFQYDGVHAMIFYVRQQGVYDDINMYIATLNDSTLADMQMILEYRKNLTEYYSGQVSFEAGGGNTIRVVMQKNRRYPVEQTNAVSYRYTIETDGNIEEEVVSQ